ncbi:unnamed protein product [Bursaphelenchus xylophilus]|uniref:Aminopeptidase n=1 Tax=Bursaphelenchus xylophilus TaxID=6326 RepID=A0A1I7RI12_BURXY|nr:unnamed protein product [Bursaphelenchus xylophilus]CAG9115234.1 unnamed protein product [Bursaphelenchus xylophilus]
MTKEFSKLPTFAYPTAYSIYLKPDINTFNCLGKVTITINIVESTNLLQLHAEKLKFTDVSLVLESGKALERPSLRFDETWSLLFVDLGSKIEPQLIKLTFEYEFTLNEHLNGFYRSNYKDSEGKQKCLLSTFLCPTYARKVFPCYDEPIYKATFQVELEVSKGLTALSNMPVESQIEKDDTKLFKYVTSPPMSTYLVAFAVGELEYIEETASNGIPIRVYTTPGKQKQGKYALEVALKALVWYEKWFNIPYSLPKCDLIAIPDFTMGAMENWGLVTYREVALLIDDTKSSSKQKSRVALIVAHELAHFWFGDLVTMKWWTDLWLNEGFASFMEYVFVDQNTPEFKIWLHFLTFEVSRGFRLDSLNSTHPIEVEISNPNELDEIYDAITYAKACSVNRMLYCYLGAEKYQKGLQIYLNQFKFKNAETKDLWRALGEASGEDVDKLMSSWTKQEGFPLISVSEERLNDGKVRLHLKQDRFIADGSTDSTLWHVPITVTTESRKDFKFLLSKKEDSFVIDGISDGEYIKLNAETTGFYRVHYSTSLIDRLLKKYRELATADRFGLANDTFVLLNAGKTEALRFIELIENAKDEREYVVWETLDSGIGSLANVLARNEDENLKKKFDQFIIGVMEGIGEDLGWTPKEREGSQVPILRSLILSRLSKCGHQPTISTAISKFNAHVANGSPLLPDQRALIYSTVARNCGKDGIEKLKRIFETCGFSEVENDVIFSLGQVPERELLKDVFEYGVVNGKVRNQDLASFFYGAVTHKVGQDYCWTFFKDNLQLLLTKFGSVNSNLFQNSFKLAGNQQSSKQFIDEFEAFCKANFTVEQQKILDRPLRQTVEFIRINEKLRTCEDVLKRVLL